MKASNICIAIIAVVAPTVPAKPVFSFKGNDRVTIEDGAERGLSKFEGFPGNDVGGHNLVFHLDPGRVLRIFTSPRTEELTIRLQGRKGPLSDDERAYLTEIQELLVADADTNRCDDAIDSVGCQGLRAAGLLARWPEEVDLDYTLDLDAENARAQAMEEMREQHPVPDDAPVPGDQRRLRKTQAETARIEYDEKRHPNRRLVDLSLCTSLNSGVPVLTTHDCNKGGNGADKTTFYAFLTTHSGCTKFWNGAWSCLEPDHSTSIEYAYGDCFGRCGEGCGSGHQYTQDCANHDNCVRFGHSIVSWWCNDEFSFTVDDVFWAPNCY